jgi:integrase
VATAYEYHGAWFIQWTENGQRKKEWIGRSHIVTEREAKLRAKAKEVELSTGKILFSGVPTLSEFKTEYLNWYEKEYPSSYFRVEQIIEQHLEPEFGILPMDYVKGKPIEDYKHKRKEAGAKTATIVKELRTLKAMLNRAWYWDILPNLPIKRIEEPKELDSKPPRFFTKKELGQIYEVSKDYRWTWALLANTGLRRSEAIQLRTKDVHKDFIRVLSTNEHRTKDAEWRDIPITDNARKALKKIDGEDGYVLPRIRPESLSRAAIKAVERAKVGPGSIHTFRHTYASHLVIGGVPIRTVQLLLGHSKIETTEIYTHLSKDHLQRHGRRINL